MRYSFSGHESFQCKSLLLKKDLISFVPEVSLATQTVLLGLAWAKTWLDPFDSGSVLGDNNILLCYSWTCI